MRAILFVTSVVLSVGFAVASQAAAPSPYTQICDSSRLRSVERADCRAQMKAAPSDDARRDVYAAFNLRANGTFGQDSVPAKPEQNSQAQH